MESQDRALVRAMRAQVEERFPDEPVFRGLVDAMERRVDYHRNKLRKTKQVSGIARAVFSWTIPILAAAVTALTTMPGEQYRAFAGWIGFAVTMFTVVNSTFRPSEQWLSSTHLLIRLHDWEMDLVVRLRQVQTVQAAYELLAAKDAELSQVGAEMTTILSATGMVRDGEQGEQWERTPAAGGRDRSPGQAA